MQPDKFKEELIKFGNMMYDSARKCDYEDVAAIEKQLNKLLKFYEQKWNQNYGN